MPLLPLDGLCDWRLTLESSSTGVKEVTWRRGKMRCFHRHTDAAMETMPLHGLQKDRHGQDWKPQLCYAWNNGIRRTVWSKTALIPEQKLELRPWTPERWECPVLAMAASCAAGCWCCRVWVQPCCLPLPRPASYGERENEIKREVNFQKLCTVCH